jgi:signal transduction histidine kinase
VRLAEAAEAVRHQAERVIHLIGQLLDTSQIDRGEKTLDRRVSEITSLVRSAVTTSAMAEPRAVLKFHASEEILAYVDPTAVQQIVTNLLDNAERFSPPGEPIEVVVGRKNADAVFITVSDRGRGIPEKLRPHIFERFARGDGGGLGLGLYICHELVLRHGGTIAASFPGQGTRFEVVLPIGRVRPS